VPQRQQRRGRRATCEHELLPALRKVWATLGRPYGKRLAPVMATTVAALAPRRAGSLRRAARAAQRGLGGHPDRLHAPERRRLRPQGTRDDQARHAAENPDPVRTFTEWDHARARGEFPRDRPRRP
jgi:hypothetical protein